MLLPLLQAKSPAIAVVTGSFLVAAMGACASKTPDEAADGGNSGRGGTATGGTATGGTATGGTATGGTASSGGSGATTGGAGGAPAAGSAGASGTGTSMGGGAGASGGAAGGGAAAGSGAGSGGSTGIAGNGCTPGRMTTSGTLMGRFDSTKPMVDGKEYFLQVNEWGASEPQVVAYGGDFFFKMTTQMASRPTNGGPTGFPSMFIGANSRNSTMGSNLPKAVSALTTVPTTWIWNDNGTLADTTANVYNVAYDVWFSTNAAGEPTASGPTGGYLMVWLYDPPAAEPIGGEPMFEDVAIPGVTGTWDIWVGPNGSRPCISYVRTETSMGLSFDLNDFIEDAVTNRPNTIQSTWHLTNIFTGFEIWSGGVGLESTAFCAVVN
jgi:hypothetical protein